MVSEEAKPVATAFVTGLAALGFGAAFVTAGSFSHGAQIFPRITSGIAFICAGAIFLRTCFLLTRLRGSAGETRTAAQQEPWTDILVSYLGPPVYGLLFYLLGFWVSSAICLAGLLYLLGERRTWMIASLTAGTLLLIYVAFEYAFEVRMPAGVAAQFFP